METLRESKKNGRTTKFTIGNTEIAFSKIAALLYPCPLVRDYLFSCFNITNSTMATAVDYLLEVIPKGRISLSEIHKDLMQEAIDVSSSDAALEVGLTRYEIMAAMRNVLHTFYVTASSLNSQGVDDVDFILHLVRGQLEKLLDTRRSPQRLLLFPNVFMMEDLKLVSFLNELTTVPMYDSKAQQKADKADAKKLLFLDIIKPPIAEVMTGTNQKDYAMRLHFTLSKATLDTSKCVAMIKQAVTGHINTDLDQYI